MCGASSAALAWIAAGLHAYPRPRRQQPVLHPETPARPAQTRRAVPPVQLPRPAEEGPPPASRQSGRVRGRLEDGTEELLEQRPRPLGGHLQLSRPGQQLLHTVEQFGVVLARKVQPATLPPQQMPYDDRAQHRDPGGVQGGQAAEAEVGEVALGEDQSVLGEEGAPVDGAPRGQLDAGQLRCLDGGERALRGLRQQRGGRVGRLALPPGGALVLDVQDVDVARRGQPGVQGRQGARGEAVVAVEEQQIRAGRRPQPAVARPGQARRRRRVHRPHPRVPFGVPGGHGGGRHLGRVADRDQLEVAEGLGEDGVQRQGQPAGDPMGRDDDAEAGHAALSLSLLLFRPYGRGAPPAARWTAGSGWAATSRWAWELPEGQTAFRGCR